MSYMKTFKKDETLYDIKINTIKAKFELIGFCNLINKTITLKKTNSKSIIYIFKDIYSRDNTFQNLEIIHI